MIDFYENMISELMGLQDEAVAEHFIRSENIF